MSDCRRDCDNRCERDCWFRTEPNCHPRFRPVFPTVLQANLIIPQTIIPIRIVVSPGISPLLAAQQNLAFGQVAPNVTFGQLCPLTLIY